MERHFSLARSGKRGRRPGASAAKQAMFVREWSSYRARRAAAAILRVALEMGRRPSDARRGVRAPARKAGSARAAETAGGECRETSPCAAPGQAVAGRLRSAGPRRRFGRDDAREMIAQRLARAAICSTAGNCHMREKSAPSPFGCRTISVRPRGSSSTAAATVIRTGAALRRADGNCSAMPSECARHQRATGHCSQRGETGVQIVAPSSIIASFQSPGASQASSASAVRSSRRRVRGRARRSRTAPSRASTRATLPSSAASGFTVGDAQDGGGGVAADAGQLQRGFALARELRRRAAPQFHARRDADCARGSSSPGRPTRRALTICGRAPGAARSEISKKSFVVGNHRGHARLLQHDFRDPDAIGVARATPGKVALVAAEPGEQRRRNCGSAGNCRWVAFREPWARHFRTGTQPAHHGRERECSRNSTG